MDNTLSVSTGISLWILRLAKPFSLLSDIVFLRYVLILRRVEKERSAVLVDTGIVMKILSRMWMFGKIVLSQIFRKSIALTWCALFRWRKACQTSISAINTFKLLFSKTQLIIIKLNKLLYAHANKEHEPNRPQKASGRGLLLVGCGRGKPVFSHPPLQTK